MYRKLKERYLRYRQRKAEEDAERFRQAVIDVVAERVEYRRAIRPVDEDFARAVDEDDAREDDRGHVR